MSGENHAIPLRTETSNLSDYTVDSNSTVVQSPDTPRSPSSPVHHRPGYRRIASLTEEDTAYHVGQHSRHVSESALGTWTQGYGQGLGIRNLKSLPETSAARVPIGSKSNPSTPGSAKSRLSPSSGQFQRGYNSLNSPIAEDSDTWEDNGSKASLYQPFAAESEEESLRKQPSVPATHSFEPSGKKILVALSHYLHLKSQLPSS